MKMRQKKKLHMFKDRLRFAKKWVSEFSDEQFKFQLQHKVNESISLDDKQKKALKLVAEILKHGKWTEQTLFNEFYNICRDEAQIDPKEFFKAAYLVLLNKERGPKLAPFYSQ